MANQPVAPCKLRRGKALSAFPSFVDTFNWLVDFCTNLKGEGETPQAQDAEGASDLRVDRSASDHPVIRGGKGGGGKLVIIDNQDPPNEVEIKGELYLASSDDSDIKFNIMEIDGRYILTVTPDRTVNRIIDIGFDASSGYIQVKYENDPDTWVNKIPTIKHSEVGL